MRCMPVFLAEDTGTWGEPAPMPDVVARARLEADMVGKVMAHTDGQNTETQHRLTAPTATDEASKAALEQEPRAGPCRPTTDAGTRTSVQASHSLQQLGGARVMLDLFARAAPGTLRQGRGPAPLIRSAFWPLCFNDFCKLFVALGEGDASVSLAALRKAGSLVPPLLGALLVSFGIPAIRHQNLYSTDVHGVAHFSRRECDQIATYGELSHYPPRL